MNNLRKIRRSQDVTQYELSIKTEIPQSTLSLIERSFREPTKEMEIRIAKILGRKIEEIFPG